VTPPEDWNQSLNQPVGAGERQFQPEGIETSGQVPVLLSVVGRVESSGLRGVLWLGETGFDEPRTDGCRISFAQSIGT